MTEVTFGNDSAPPSPIYWYTNPAHAPGFQDATNPAQVEVPLADIGASSRVRIGLPIAAIPELPEWQRTSNRQRTSFHAVSAVDEGGRLSVKWLLQALGWVPGDRLEAHVRGPVIAMGPSGSARIRLPRDHTVRIPALLCRAAGLRGGDRVLVTADTGHNRLIVFPQHVLDAMVIRQLTDENGATK